MAGLFTKRGRKPKQRPNSKRWVGTAVAAVAAIPFVQTDWQRPIAQRHVSRVDTSQGRMPSSIPPLLQIKTMDTSTPVRRPQVRVDTSQGRLPSSIPPPPPVIRTMDTATPARRPQARQADLPPNLLTSTLAPAAATVPFRQADWPNPVRSTRVVNSTHHRSSYDPVAPTEPLPIGRQQDWPNPIRGFPIKHHEFTLTAYAQPIDPLLVIQKGDWPNPVRLKPRPQQWTPPNLLTTTLATPAVPPLTINMWQNPVRLKPRPQPWDPPNLLLSTLFVPADELPPGRQQDWPNPVRERIRHVSYTFTGTPLPNEIPPSVTPPDPTTPSFYPTGSSTGGGGGGGEWYRENKHRPTVYQKLRKDIQEVRVEEGLIRDVYAELKKSEMAAQVAGDAVRPYQSADGEIEWGGVARDPEAVRALMQAALQEQRRRDIAEDDADWEWF